MKGKVAIVTGGASGLGAADARLLAREGASVVITDISSELGEKTAASIPGAIFIQHDVRDENQWREVVGRSVDHFGGLHVLVNNAGIVRSVDFEECSLESFRMHAQVMAEGTFLGCKHALSAMVASGCGSIINVSSIGAEKPDPLLVAYASAKASILAITRAVAMHCQVKGYPVRANSVLPGAHDTPMTQAALADLPPDDPSLEFFNTVGFSQPEEVANMVLFLASDESRKINGSKFYVDNGEMMR